MGELVQLKSDNYLHSDEKISINNFKPNKSEILMTKKGSLDKDSAKLLVLNNENKKVISDFDYEIFDVTNGIKEKILEGHSRDPIELSQLKDNSKYEISVKSNGFSESISQFEISNNKLSKNQFLLDPLKSLNKDSTRIILKDKNNGEEISEFNYEIYDITNGKRERVYAKLSDLKRLNSEGKYEIKIQKEGYKNSTDTFDVKDNNLSKNT